MLKDILQIIFQYVITPSKKSGLAMVCVCRHWNMCLKDSGKTCRHQIRQTIARFLWRVRGKKFRFNEARWVTDNTLQISEEFGIPKLLIREMFRFFPAFYIKFTEHDRYLCEDMNVLPVFLYACLASLGLIECFPKLTFPCNAYKQYNSMWDAWALQISSWCVFARRFAVGPFEPVFRTSQGVEVSRQDYESRNYQGNLTHIGLAEDKIMFL